MQLIACSSANYSDQPGADGQSGGTHDRKITHMERGINLHMIDVPFRAPMHLISPIPATERKTDSQTNHRPLAMPNRTTPPRLPPITHIHPASGKQEVTRDAVVLVTLRDDTGAVECACEVYSGVGRGGGGEGVAVDSETGLPRRKKG